VHFFHHEIRIRVAKWLATPIVHLEQMLDEFVLLADMTDAAFITLDFRPFDRSEVNERVRPLERKRRLARRFDAHGQYSVDSALDFRAFVQFTTEPREFFFHSVEPPNFFLVLDLERRDVRAQLTVFGLQCFATLLERFELLHELGGPKSNDEQQCNEHGQDDSDEDEDGHSTLVPGKTELATRSSASSNRSNSIHITSERQDKRIVFHGTSMRESRKKSGRS